MYICSGLVRNIKENTLLWRSLLFVFVCCKKNRLFTFGKGFHIAIYIDYEKSFWSVKKSCCLHATLASEGDLPEDVHS